MSEKTEIEGWRIYSAQRSVPFTLGTGQHNYLVLEDASGRVIAEIHGTSKTPLGGKLIIEELSVDYDEKGERLNKNPYNLGNEDRTNWVEIPATKGKTHLETWQAMKMVGLKYTGKYDYLFAPTSNTPRTPRLGDTEGQFFETMPTYNSNSAWRTILEEMQYDWEHYHPKEAAFEVSPGDSHRLPPIERTAPARPVRNKTEPFNSGPSRKQSRSDQRQRQRRPIGRGDLLR